MPPSSRSGLSERQSRLRAFEKILVDSPGKPREIGRMFHSKPQSSAGSTSASFSQSHLRRPRLLLVLLAGVLLSGCAYYPQQSSSLPLGASKEQVRNLIGSPKSTSRDGSLTTWNYGEGTVCVFKDGQLVASNYNAPAQSAPAFSLASILPPLSLNFTPAPYYYPAPAYSAPVYYGGWGRPYYGGWGGWGGYGRSYWGGNNCGNGYYRGNWNNGNWNRGNYYNNRSYRH